MNRSCNTATTIGLNAIPGLRQTKARMTKTIHVLSVGPVNRAYMLHDALLALPTPRLSIAADYRALWVISRQETIQVAVLHDALPSFELEAACRLIRRRWPCAGILILRSRVCLLDDALFDDVVASTVAMETLLAAIRRLVGARHRRRSRNIGVWQQDC
jgi:DNA-binding response OmpR family regulator